MKNAVFVLVLVLIFGLANSVSTCQNIENDNLYLVLENSIDANGQDCIIISGKNVTLDCNNFTIYNAVSGIKLAGSKNSQIQNCIIENSTNGILITGVATANASQQQTNEMEYRNTSHLIENITVKNAANGIFVFNADLNKIRYAKVTNSINGVYILRGVSNIVENSTFSTSQNGVFINNSAKINDEEHPEWNEGKNIVRNNFVLDNDIGIKIVVSNNNRIYNNYFNNTQNAETDSLIWGYINYWNTSYACAGSIINGSCSGGNFWSDYNGYDSGESIYPHNISYDGVGDTDLPYFPPGEPLATYADNLPLTKNTPPDWVNECRQFTSGGTYKVKKDIYGVISPTNHKCFEVLSSYVEINCYGHTIIDNTTYDDTYGVYVNGYAYLNLINCTVLNYTTGLYEKKSYYGRLVGNNFSNDVFDIFFDIDREDPPQISFFEKNITTDNYVSGGKVYYYVSGKTGDGYAFPPPSDAGLVGAVHMNDIVISGHTLYKNSPVVVLANVSNATVSNENVMNAGVGTAAYLSKNVLLVNSNFSNMSCASFFSLMSNNTNATGNRISDSSCNCSTSPACALYSSVANATFSFNNITNIDNEGWVILSEYTTNFLMYNNNVSNVSSSTYPALSLEYSNNSRIYNNNLSVTSIGMLVSCVKNADIFSNTITRDPVTIDGGDAAAVYLYGVCSGPPNLQIYVYNNTIRVIPGYAPWEFGIRVVSTYNSSIYNNWVEGMRYPRVVSSCLYLEMNFNYSGLSNTVYNNTFMNCTNGIVCENCMLYKIFSNNVSFFSYPNGDPSIGIWVRTGTLLYNEIYNNYIFNRPPFFGDPAEDTLGALGRNTWQLPEGRNCSRGPNIIGGQCWGGNYYSYYDDSNECDTDGDGIGDFPLGRYTITGSVYDDYPLTNVRCKSGKVKIKINENKTIELPNFIIIPKGK